jgi:hypothetical protein
MVRRRYSWVTLVCLAVAITFESGCSDKKNDSNSESNKSHDDERKKSISSTSGGKAKAEDGQSYVDSVCECKDRSASLAPQRSTRTRRRG